SLELLACGPVVEPRVPDVLVLPTAGQIYVETGTTFMAEHGGNADTDRNVPLLVSYSELSPVQIKFPVQTSQIAPSILKALGLDPASLDAVRIEKTPLLPGLDFEQISRSPAPKPAEMPRPL